LFFPGKYAENSSVRKESGTRCGQEKRTVKLPLQNSFLNPLVRVIQKVKRKERRETRSF
jgi:hypothetical protein